MKYGHHPRWFYNLDHEDRVLVLAHERALQKQSEQANRKGKRGQHTGTQRRLVGQEALDAAMGSKWGSLFQKS